MKKITAKMFTSLAGVALAAPFLALAVVVGARALTLTHNAQDQLLLVVLASGVVASGVLKGFGNRAGRAAHVARRGHVEAHNSASARYASIIHLGY